jgi:3-oxoacyl-(acyl-carrier-protein) synthase
MAMQDALQGAGLEAAEVGYVNAHGTATVANDASEAAALNALFGVRGVPVSSTKGITGHTLGAAGIVEAIITCAALENQQLPPSANLDSPDPALELNTVRQSTRATLKHAMSNNFGFGGTNCALIFSRAD